MREQLKDFGAHAETLVEIPDLADLEQRGHALRVRRRVGVAAALAAVLAVVGITASQVHQKSVDDGPVKRVHAQPYPGATMKTLRATRYEIHPSYYDRDLAAELTVPAGWNAWVGPNRFNGHAPGRSNGQALGHMTWYVGALVLEVDEVNVHGCGNPNTRILETSEEVARALEHAFATEVVRPPEQVVRFGHSATRMRLRVTDDIEDCAWEPIIFRSTTDSFIQYAPPGTVMDVWVVDLGGRPIYVQRAWTPDAPTSARSQLDSIIDSIRFKNAD